MTANRRQPKERGEKDNEKDFFWPNARPKN